LDKIVSTRHLKLRSSYLVDAYIAMNRSFVPSPGSLIAC
jgi:hypothetical protein